MELSERRGARRLHCAATAYLRTSGRVDTALITDISSQGARLEAQRLPDAGSPVSLAILVPPCRIEVAGRVRWGDRLHHRIGLALGDSHDVDAVIGVLAREAEAHRPGAAILTEDPAMAALLCELLRTRGYTPHVPHTPLEAIACFERTSPRVEVAFVAPHSLRMQQVSDFLAYEYPEIARIQVPLDSGPPVLATLVAEL